MTDIIERFMRIHKYKINKIKKALKKRGINISKKALKKRIKEKGPI